MHATHALGVVQHPVSGITVSEYPDLGLPGSTLFRTGPEQVLVWNPLARRGNQGVIQQVGLRTGTPGSGVCT